jgi:hypothetical protein
MAVISGIDAQKRKNYKVTRYSRSCGAGTEAVLYSGFAHPDAGRSSSSGLPRVSTLK